MNITDINEKINLCERLIKSDPKNSYVYKYKLNKYKTDAQNLVDQRGGNKDNVFETHEKMNDLITSIMKNPDYRSKNTQADDGFNNSKNYKSKIKGYRDMNGGNQSNQINQIQSNQSQYKSNNGIITSNVNDRLNDKLNEAVQRVIDENKKLLVSLNESLK